MNVIIPDSHLLPNNVKFPPLVAEKIDWLQYPGLNRAELEEQCCRVHCLITLNTPFDDTLLNTMNNLELLIIANPDLDLVDVQAAEKNNVTICHIPNLEPANFDISNTEQAQQLCNTIVGLIDHYQLQKS